MNAPDLLTVAATSAGLTVLAVWVVGAWQVLANVAEWFDEGHRGSRRQRWIGAALLGLPVGIGLLVAVSLRGRQ